MDERVKMAVDKRVRQTRQDIDLVTGARARVKTIKKHVGGSNK